MRRGGRPRHPKEGGEALAYRAGITDEAAVGQVVRAAADAFGAVDVLVKNALPDLKFYTFARRDLAHLGWDYYLQQLGAARGALYCAKAVVAGMVEKGGRIVSVLSNLTNTPVVAYHDYTSAKSAFLGFSRNLTAALGPHDLTVNTVAGGLGDETDASVATIKEVRNIVASSARLGVSAPPKTLGAPS
ncbi:MAG: SDR family NAD(P)-dependent oxidoreductase [Actinomycetota bacterium]|nr:SDR family NAD(P)-dependent oxidoreductase [Actinomycetota bacterium]